MDYPQSHGDITPGEGFVRMSLGRGLGDLPEGFHTGGPFYHPDAPERIYKPLDARPNANETYRRYDTDEVEALTAGLGLASFPQNWTVEEHNGRRWLVRNRADLVWIEGSFYPHLSHHELLQLEHDLRAFNARGWEIGDIYCSVLRDQPSGQPFFNDLSAAMYRGPDAKGIYAANDADRWIRTLAAWGLSSLAADRQAGRGAWAEQERSSAFQAELTISTPHVYLSYNRPFSFVWADARDQGVAIESMLIQRPDIRHGGAYGHTWVCANRPLSEGYRERYELRWCWSDWPLLPMAQPQWGDEAAIYGHR